MKIADTTILVLPYTHTLSHLSRPLEIAKFLSEYGCRIVFGGESTKTKFIKDEGFEVEALFEPDPDILYGNIRDRTIKFVDDKILDKMIREDIQLFNKVKPDVVLSDGRFSAMVSTQMAGIKHIGIVNASSTAYRAVPYIPLLKLKWLDLDNYPFEGLLNRLAAR